MAWAAAAETPDAQTILTTADQSRGAGLPGLEMQVHVRSENSTERQSDRATERQSIGIPNGIGKPGEGRDWLLGRPAALEPKSYS